MEKTVGVWTGILVFVVGSYLTNCLCYVNQLVREIVYGKIIVSDTKTKRRRDCVITNFILFNDYLRFEETKKPS